MHCCCTPHRSKSICYGSIIVPYQYCCHQLTAYTRFINSKTSVMGNSNVGGSQQQGQGVTIGTQGNEDMKIPGSAPHGPSDKPEAKEDRHIPNQERSSKNNEEKEKE